MKELIILSLLMVFPLQADQQGNTKVSSASSKTEVKSEIAKIENEIKLLEARLNQLNRELKVSVPADRAKGDLIIQVLSDGKVSVDNEKLTKEQLKKKLLNIKNLNKNLAVILRGGPKVEYQNIVDIIDLCQAAGVPNISFSTHEKQTEQDVDGKP